MPSSQPLDLAQFAGHTPGPLEWRKVDKSYALWGAYGMRPIVLDVFRGELRCRNVERCLMIPLDPEHPDMRLLQSAPALLAECRRQREEIARLRGALQRIVDIRGSTGGPAALVAEFKNTAILALAASEGEGA